MSILFLFAFSIQTASALTITISDASGYIGEGAEVPVNIKDAADVGSIDLTILYDPTVLNISKVEKGDLVKGMLSSNIENEGIISIGIADSNGISGDGEIVKLTFDVIGNGSAPITLQNAKAYDVNTHADIEVSVENGDFQANYKTTTGGSGTPGFELQTLIIVLISSMFILRLRRK